MNKRGFTLIEMVVVIAAVAILAAVLTPTIAKSIQDAKTSRARNEVQVISSAIADIYKDTGYWIYTDSDGPAGNSIDVVYTYSTYPHRTGPDAQPGAANWYGYGQRRCFYDYAFFNNPDDDFCSTNTTNHNQPNQDYPTTGDFRWKGPYVDKMWLQDPWGQGYLISVRYLPGGEYDSTHSGATWRIHSCLVLSAGPDGGWSTSYDDGTGTPDDLPAGDDVGWVVSTNQKR